MGLFNFGKKKDENKKTEFSKEEALTKVNEPDADQIEFRRKYGKAFRMLASETKYDQGIQIFKELDKAGYSEATLVLGMFPETMAQRKSYVKKAADAGNIEAIWEYTDFLPHSFIPSPANKADVLWEQYCLKAAENGSVDGMNEMGNIFNRRNNYAESMYWYAMANAHGHKDGAVSLKGISMKWASAGCPYNFMAGSPKFDKARHKCAITYLEMHAGKKVSTGPDEIVKLVLDGVPIAAYLAGDIFESLGNDEMAYEMYNAIAFEHDAHGIKCYADMLFAGKGVEQDVQSAIRFYEQAAELGERDAMFIMGEFTKDKDKDIAGYWYGLANTRGQEHAWTRMKQIAE